MSSNTDHHIKYVTRLMEDIHDDGQHSPRLEKRFNKLIYCLSKLVYNTNSGRTTREYIMETLNPRLKALGLPQWAKDIFRKALEEVKRREGITLQGLLDQALLDAE